LNDHNPSAPPVSEVADAVAPPSKVRKPVSVWLLQIVCVLMALLIVPLLAIGYENWRAASGIARIAILIGMLITLLVATLLVWAVIAAQRRSQFGRWLGVIVMGSIVAIAIFIIVSAEPNAHMPDAAIAVFFAVVSLIALAATSLLFSSAFSKRARAWYGKP
jgi:hypothetical protein